MKVLLLSRVWHSFLPVYFPKAVTPHGDWGGGGSVICGGNVLHGEGVGVLAAFIKITVTHTLGEVALSMHHPTEASR